ncbi:TB2/DP1, HVA22 family-domain-containing protein [Cristinia sonorae]|uniref:Protein YOP1 n=1 Tax=Cristinia sonorae TaxID=1940300 RepID=A0A8K0UMH6_9AGAR|nr:TB2/DP1, HVA22 family-domain-containing protein [Cristinia sonorae]
MLMSLLSHALSAWFAFLLPCYGTWKALSHRPVSEPELERWAKYWSVIGAFVAFEYVAEWFISWFPFYWELKTIVLLFLALPQTQGSTWVYNTYLDPLLAKNEADIDAGITAAQTNILNFLQAQVKKAWETLWRLMTGAAVASQQDQNPANPSSTPAQPPSAAPNPFALAKGLWGAYGPSVVGVMQRYTQSSAAVSATASSEAQRPNLTPVPSSQSTTSAGPSFPEPQHL